MFAGAFVGSSASRAASVVGRSLASGVPRRPRVLLGPRGGSSSRLGACASRPRIMEALADVPLPIWIGVGVFILHIIVITDTGAGAPILFPIFKRFMKPFRPTKAYERIKSKYVT